MITKRERLEAMAREWRQYADSHSGERAETLGHCSRVLLDALNGAPVPRTTLPADQPAPTETAPSGHRMACGCAACVERRDRHEDWLGITPSGVPVMAETSPQGAPRWCKDCPHLLVMHEGGFCKVCECTPRPPIEFCCKRCGLTVDEVAGGACASLAGPEHDWSNPRSGVVK